MSRKSDGKHANNTFNIDEGSVYLLKNSFFLSEF
jgi:hypothetical protein